MAHVLIPKFFVMQMILANKPQPQRALVLSQRWFQRSVVPPKKEKSSETGSGPLEFHPAPNTINAEPSGSPLLFTFVRNQFEIDRLPLIETAEAGALLQSSIEAARK
jgi:hypothetical protein